MAQVSWIGQTLNGRYKIDELLGQGGMSAVYKATDPNLRRVVAVKMIHPHLSNNPEFVRRFEDEAAAVAQLRHSNIVQVYDFSHDGDVYYMVLEFLPGETLQQRLERLNQKGRQMGLGEAVSHAAQVADALQYAHERGIIHRDIKPANIMLDIYGKANLMDFGIARIVGGQMHTATGAVVGTALYMSPEQIVGQRVDERADIYSLGVTLFETLSGRPPFEADSAMTLMMMHINDPVPDLRELRPQVPEELIAVVEKALSKKAEDRYQKSGELAAALRKVAAGLPPDAMQSGVRARPVDSTQIEPPTSAPPPAPLADRTQMDPPQPAAAAQAAEPSNTQIDRPTGEPTPVDRPEFAPPREAFTAPEVSPARDYTPALTPLYPTVQPDNVTQLDLPETNRGMPGGAPPAARAATGGADRFDPSPRKLFGLPVALAGGLGILILAVLIGLVYMGGRLLLGGTGGTNTPTAEIVQATATSPVLAAALQPSETPAPTDTATPAPTDTPALPTDTPTPEYSPTPTVPSDRPYVRINNITIQDGRYVVDYETFQYTEVLPGMHVHFYYDTVLPEQAGVPGKGPWILYGGPRPFNKYLVAERPLYASQMCALVANPNHSIHMNSGTCFPLPVQ